MYSKLKKTLQHLFFSEAAAMVRVGRERPLQAGDFPRLPKTFEDVMNVSSAPRLDVSHGPWGYLKSLAHEFRRGLAASVGLNAIRMVAGLLSPLFLYQLVAAASNGTETRQAVFSALALSISSIVMALASQHYFYQTLTLGMRMRALVSTQLYHHALRFPRWRRVSYETGDLVNHLGIDAYAVSEAPFVVSELAYAATVIIGVAALLFHFIDLAALVPFVLLLVLMPVSRYVGKRFIKIQSELMGERDKRVSLLSQALSGIRVVKFFGWDKRIREEIQARRHRELGWLRRMVTAGSISELVFYMTTTLLAFGSFATYLLMGHDLDAATVFACLALFGKLEEPFGQLTHIVGNLAQARVSSERLVRFLREEPLPEPAHQELSPVRVPIGVRLSDVTLRHADVDVLRGVDLAIAPGEAVAVIGPVGCGKTSLLLAMLGEISHRSGRIEFTGIGEALPRLAYVPQEAFLLNASLRHNITFGAVDERLAGALHAACLEEDVAAFPNGLETEIGEHGVNLSGGQKQRVSLARAMLQDPGLVLLDDPLSAVDFATENALVERLVFGEWRDVTRIVVTHRLAHLVRFDRVVFVENGEIAAVGRYADLLREHPRFREFVSQHVDPVIHAAPVAAALPAAAGAGHLTEFESREIGKVDMAHFWHYFRAMGGEPRGRAVLALGGLIGILLLAVSLQLVQDGWLAAWTSWLDSDQSQITFGATADRMVAALGAEEIRSWLGRVLTNDFSAITIYGCVGLLFMVATFVRFISWGRSAVVAARDLHDKALTAVMAAPLRMFDSNPVGRILNRFSNDMEKLEHEVSWSFENTLFTSIRVVVALAVMVTVFPPVAIAVLVLSFALYRLQKTYRASSREAQRLTSLSHSPLLSHFKETLNGLTVIRAMRKEDEFAERFRSWLDNSLVSFHGMVLLNRWFTVRIPLMTGLLTMVVALGIAWLASRGAIASGMAGLALTYSLNFWSALTWSIRSFSVLETSMISVERVRDYGKIEAEPSVTRRPALPESVPWPSRGAVEFDGVVVRYAPHLPDVLKGVSFRVAAGSRVGIVGRTGSGKSTLFQTLFRFVPIRKGRVLIDGVDLAAVPLDRLRQSVAIIPQSPTLFVGTLRTNLDRFAQYSDAEIWEALGKVFLRDFIATLPGGLDAEVKENGENFSLGQRQLLCLARALLVRARVLVMDEATASVDVETDALIQKTIRTAFQGVTVLIIAHRLDTVADCDAIVELQDGRVVNEERRTQETAEVVRIPSMPEAMPVAVQ